MERVDILTHEKQKKRDEEIRRAKMEAEKEHQQRETILLDTATEFNQKVFDLEQELIEAKLEIKKQTGEITELRALTAANAAVDGKAEITRERAPSKQQERINKQADEMKR